MTRNSFVKGFLLAAACTGAVFAGCGSSVMGIYASDNSSVLLEVRSGGQATLTFMGLGNPCTYNVEGKLLSLTCTGQNKPVQLTINQDGTLTGPPGTLFPPLRKSKS
jgi:hypothetical protein